MEIDKQLKSIDGPFQLGVTLLSREDKNSNFSRGDIELIMKNATLHHAADEFISNASSNVGTNPRSLSLIDSNQHKTLRQIMHLK